MADSQGSRLRKVALTGALTPGLILGAAGALGYGVLPGVSTPSAAAQSVLATGACTAFSPSTSAPASDMSPADVAQEATPAVVTIVNMQPLSQADMNGVGGVQVIPGFPGIDQLPGIGDLPSGEMPGSQQQQGDAVDSNTLVPIGSGSGFIVDEQGHVVTNAHVIDGAQKLTAVLTDGTELDATVVGSDPLLDVAVIKLDLTVGVKVPGVAAFGDSDSLRPGDEVVAIGNALGSFPNTVSDGTVNGVHRAFPDQGGLSMMIQHDANIWHGNSGGPLLNLHGQVVGVNTAGIGSSAMGTDTGAADMAFAIEGNTVCKAAAQLIDKGEIVWPYMGLQGEATADGQGVVEVVEGGPSAKAGIEPGDVITEFGGQTIDQQHSLLDLLFQHEPGDVVSVRVDRNGAPQTFQVTLGERPQETQ